MGSPLEFGKPWYSGNRLLKYKRQIIVGKSLESEKIGNWNMENRLVKSFHGKSLPFIWSTFGVRLFEK